jgi:hypothetical protein
MNPLIPFLAQILGPFYIIVAILFLFRGKLIDDIMDDFKKSPALSYVGGMFAFLIGIVWLLGIFSWANFTESVFTLFGIMAVIKGILLMIYPELIWKSVYKSPLFKMGGALLTGVIGIWFLSLGYGLF